MVPLKAFTDPVKNEPQIIDLGPLFSNPIRAVSLEEFIKVLKEKVIETTAVYSFDLDGTLTTNFKLDLNGVASFLFGLIANEDVTIVINTGRSLPSLLKTINDIDPKILQSSDLTRFMLLADNGASFAYFEKTPNITYALKTFRVDCFSKKILQRFSNEKELQFSDITECDSTHLKFLVSESTKAVEQFVTNNSQYEFQTLAAHGVFKYRNLSKGESLALLIKDRKSVHFGDSWNDVSTLNKVDLLVSVRNSNITPPLKVKAQHPDERTTIVLHSPAGIAGVKAVFESGCLNSFLDINQ